MTQKNGRPEQRQAVGFDFSRSRTPMTIISAVRLGFHISILLIILGFQALQPEFVNADVLFPVYILMGVAFTIQSIYLIYFDRALNSWPVTAFLFFFESAFITGLIYFTGVNQSIFQGYFGMRSDRSGRRTPFVQWGYALSAMSKPMMGMLAAPLWILFSRALDRLGKGIRTGARDALLNDETSPATRDRVFGFHRGMDTLGAVVGPALALLYLWWRPGDYVALFYVAFAPGVIAVVLSLLLKERRLEVRNEAHPRSFFAFLRYWKSGPAAYRSSPLAFCSSRSSTAAMCSCCCKRRTPGSAIPAPSACTSSTTWYTRWHRTRWAH